MKKRFVVVLFIVWAISLALAGCAGTQQAPGETEAEQEQPVEEASPEEAPDAADGPDQSAETADQTEAEEEPTELVVGVGADGYRLEGAGADLGIRPPGPANITEPLVRITPDYEIVPWLAESWEYTGDNTWRFQLRQAVKFHNGDEFDAEAAKWSIDRQNEWFPLFPPESVTAVDRYTLEIKTSRPFFYVPQALSHPSYAMYSPDGDPGSNPIGTGPFQFDQYSQNQFIRVVKFDDYWGEPARVDTVTLRFIPDPGARVLALQSRDVDMILPVPRDNVPQVEAMADVELHVSKAISYWALYFATRNQEPPFDLLSDIRLRQAINYAIDRETIASQVFDGYAEPARSLTPAVVNATVDANVQGYSYDPERAAELFAEAGWTDSDGDGILDKDGQRLTLVLVSGFPPAEEAKPIPELIQAQLRAVGIDAQLVEFNDVGAYYDYIMDTGEVHLILESGSWNSPDVSFLTFTVFCGCNPEGEAVLYERFWLDEEFDESVMASQGAENTEMATEAAVRTAQIMVDEFVGVAPIVYVPQIGATRSYVQGFTIHPSNYSQSWASVSVTR